MGKEEQRQRLQRPELTEVILEGKPGEWTSGKDENGVRTAYRERDGVLVIVKETERQLVMRVDGIGLVGYEIVRTKEGSKEEVYYSLTAIQTEARLQIDSSGNDVNCSWTAGQQDHRCSVPGRSYYHETMQEFFWKSMENGGQPGDHSFVLDIISEPVTIEI